MRVSPSTVYAWKQDANNPARSETQPETKPNATGKANAPKQAPRRSQPNAGEPSPPSDQTAALLAAKDAQIALLTTELVRWQGMADKLTEALSDEREARRRSDVLQLQAAQRPALPSPDVTANTTNRTDRLLFAVAVAGLVLLAIALLTAKG